MLMPMPTPPHLAPTAFSIAAVFVWGTSDFVGGYAARRSNAFVLTMIGHLSGLILMVTLALVNHSARPSQTSIEWALGAGLSGGAALAIFYRALAQGRMGLTAPVAAVLGAAIPTIFAIVTEGLPGMLQLAGFILAALGILLISRTEDGSSPDGLGLAVLAGIGFAGFYLCMKQAGSGSALWLSAASRTSSLLLTAVIVSLGGNFRQISASGVRLGMLAGCLDVTGSAMFIRASQTGRLDSAVVLTSLYPAVTVLLARWILREHFTPWRTVGMFAALLALPLIALQ